MGACNKIQLHVLYRANPENHHLTSAVEAVLHCFKTIAFFNLRLRTSVMLYVRASVGLICVLNQTRKASTIFFNFSASLPTFVQIMYIQYGCLSCGV
jgi:hypothetical protein